MSNGIPTIEELERLDIERLQESVDSRVEPLRNGRAVKSRNAIPKKNDASADVVYTPDYLAARIVEHFKPTGEFLDPCCGGGAFFSQCVIRGLSGDWFDIAAEEDWQGDFFQYTKKVDWIISNPPYSILRPWLQHSYKVADNIVYLVQMPRPFFKALLEDAEKAGFGLKEIYRVPVPKEWREVMSPFGGGYCAAHWQRGWNHDTDGIKISGSCEVTP